MNMASAMYPTGRISSFRREENIAHWSKEEKERVRRYLGDSIICEFVGYNWFCKRTTTQIGDKIETAELILGYSKGANLYIAWNAFLHRQIRNRKPTGSLSFGMVNFLKIDEIYGMRPVYHRPNGFSGNYEKLLAIKPYFLHEFCENPFSYLLPDPSDEGYKENTLYASPACPEPRIWREIPGIELLETARRRCNCTRAIREGRFKDRVFQKYSPPHCEICGIDLEPILEAAHIVAVKDKGSDATENGMCLCRNHHRMFDKGLICIDIRSKTFVITNPEAATLMNLEVEKSYPLK